MISEKIGPYELTQMLGEGAFGQVWVAVDTRLGRKVAIKALRSEVKGDQDTVARFRSEARNLAGLNHPNIAMLHDVYEHGSSEIMIMEFVPGETLESVLQRRHRLTVPEVVAVAAQAIAGLAHAHHAGLIHRDIKLTNIMVSESGTLKIMDFGLARARGSLRQTKVGQAMGTPYYLSPEQCRGGEGDERSDQYSLAIVLFEMLTGQPPFTADNDFDLMRAHIETPPPSLRRIVPQVSKAMDTAITRALSKNSSDRFNSIEEFGAAINIESARANSPAQLLHLLTAAATPAENSTHRPHTQSAPQEAHTEKLPPPKKVRALNTGKLVAFTMTPLLIVAVGAAGYHFYAARADGSLPAPSDQADLNGKITSVISGNAISVNARPINLYGVIDKAVTAHEVGVAQDTLKNLLPESVLCYRKPDHKYECFDSNSPHTNIALIAIDHGLVKADKNIPEGTYREAEQLNLKRR
jgi:serine/threonine protein kinase